MTEENTLPEGEYAIVELLGHRTLVGRIAEVERFGTKFLMIEPIFQGKLLDAVYHHGTALYGFTPCTRETALIRAPKYDYQLPAPVLARIEKALPAPGHLLSDHEIEDIVAADVGDDEAAHYYDPDDHL